MADDFTLSSDVAAQPLDLNSLGGTSPFITPQSAPVGMPPAGSPQASKKKLDFSQFAPLLALLPLAAKSGRGAVVGLLQGFHQAQVQQQAQTRQQTIDAQTAQDKQSEIAHRAADDRATQQQRTQGFLQQFSTALNGVDNPDAAKALVDFYSAQAPTFGVNPAFVQQFAAKLATPDHLLEKQVSARWNKMTTADKELAQKTGASLQIGEQTIPYAKWAPIVSGGIIDPNTGKYPVPPPKPADDLSRASLEAQAADALRRGDQAEYQRLLQVSRDMGNAARKPGGSGLFGGDTSTQSDTDAIADAIVKGDQPPTVTGLYGKTAAVRAALAKRGYDMTTATLDYQATQQHFKTLNGAQQTRMRQAIDNASHSLDVIDALAQQWQGGQFPLLNKARLGAAKSGALGPQAQQIATQLEAQISDVTSELGNVYMGGNSPTDHALQLAAKNLQANWSLPQLKSALDLARQNLRIRENSILNTGVVSPSNTGVSSDAPSSQIEIGKVYNHPQLGRVKVVGTNPDGTLKVEKAQ